MNIVITWNWFALILLIGLFARLRLTRVKAKENVELGIELNLKARIHFKGTKKKHGNQQNQGNQLKGLYT